MRSFDFAPLHRSTVGFDQIANLMDRVMANDAPQPSYPPYNIEKLDDDSYRISIAVAGFTEGDLGVEVREKSLIVSARKADEDTDKTYLHRGIAARRFHRTFLLAESIEVDGATLDNGLLNIDLVRPEPAQSVRTVEIQRRTAKSGEKRQLYGAPQTHRGSGRRSV